MAAAKLVVKSAIAVPRSRSSLRFCSSTRVGGISKAAPAPVPAPASTRVHRPAGRSSSPMASTVTTMPASNSHREPNRSERKPAGMRKASTPSASAVKNQPTAGISELGT